MITDDGALVPDGGPILHLLPSPPRPPAVRRTIGSAELAARYGVNEKTPSRWCKAGRCGPEGVLWFRTPGGHLRFWLDKVEAFERGEDVR